MDKKAQFGLTTLIIFIALIATAAIAAGVILYTTGALQQRALSVGSKAEERVATGVEVIQVNGYQYDPTMQSSNDKLGKITGMGIVTRLMTGSRPVNFNDLALLFTDENEFYSINFEPVPVPKMVKLRIGGTDVYLLENQRINTAWYGAAAGTEQDVCVKQIYDTGTAESVDLDVGCDNTVDTTLDNSTTTSATLGGVTFEFVDAYFSKDNPTFPTTLVTKLIGNSRYITGFLVKEGIADPIQYGFYWDPTTGYTEDALITEVRKVASTLINGGADIKTGSSLVGYQIKDEDMYLEDGELYEILVVLPFAVSGTGNYVSPGEEWELRLVPKEGHITYITSIAPEVMPYSRVVMYPK